MCFFPHLGETLLGSNLMFCSIIYFFVFFQTIKKSIGWPFDAFPPTFKKKTIGKLLDVFIILGIEKETLNHWLMIFFPYPRKRPSNSHPMHFPHTRLKKTIKRLHDVYPLRLRKRLWPWLHHRIGKETLFLLVFL